MNECGVEFQVLSLTSPGPQGLSNPEEAQALAARANDYLAQEVKKNPKRCITSFSC
jgi:2,3-dihydroxybenzoate decarboxylase